MDKIPNEILELVAGYASRRDLLSLALVSSGLRPSAERQLYLSVTVDVLLENCGALATLSRNAVKARHVRFLSVEFDPGMRQHSLEANAGVVDYLVTALWNTTMLVDLRLRLYRSNHEVFARLSQSLLSGRFQLSTLFCAESLDLASIVRSHPSLHTLGVFGDHPVRPIPPLDRSSILVLHISPCVPGHGQIYVTLFPDLLNEHLMHDLAERVRTALNADVGRHVSNKPDNVSSVEFQLDNFTNPGKLKAVLKAVHDIWGATLRALAFYMRSDEGLFSDEAVEVLHAFPNVLAIRLFSAALGHEGAETDAQRSTLRTYTLKWGAKLTSLAIVTYDSTVLVRMGGTNWQFTP